MEFLYFFLYFLIYFLGPVLLFFYIFLYNRYTYWERNSVASLRPPNLWKMTGNMTGKLFLDIQNCYDKLKHNKPFIGFYILLKPAVIITDFDLVKNVLIKDFDYFHDRGGYHNERDDPLSVHLLNLEGIRWKNMRSKLTPTFSSAKMKYMFSTVVDLGNRLSDTIEQCIKENNGRAVEIEIRDLMSRYSIDMIGTCAFGIECNSLKDPNAEFFTVGKEIFEISGSTIFSRFFCNNFKSLARALKMKTHTDKHIAFFKNVVHQTIETREKNNIHRKDFMDLLIEMKNSKDCPITFTDILANCFVFFAAGYETSSSVMTFVLYELAQHSHIQQKVREEIEAVLKKHNGELTYEAIGEMTYLNQVINETLRTHTPGTATLRICTKDYPVPDTNFTIKKGTNVILPYYSYHMDPNYYDNPNEFNPENFTQEAVSARHPMAFLPFGDGPRNCIGLRFGKMETKIGLAILLKNFKFTNSPNTKVPIEINWNSFMVLRPKDLKLNVEKLNKY